MGLPLTSTRVGAPHPHVELDPRTGSPLVRGTAVPVRRLWVWHRRGVSVETLVRRYPSLGWARVLDALSYAHDNEELMEADLAREISVLGERPSRPPP